jgi:two-component system, chemotaxis family, response regulator Rcp1
LEIKPIKPIEILLVEDNPADVRLIIEALKEGKVLNRLNVAWDGVEAVEFLRQKGAYVGALRPDVILLDLKMPKKNGHEVLAEIKADPGLASIPVFVLTSSDAEIDIIGSHSKHVQSYITKPLEFDKFISAILSVDNFWVAVVNNSRDDIAH